MAKKTAASAAEKIAALQEAAVKANNDLLQEMKAAGLPIYNGLIFFTTAFKVEQIEGGTFGDFELTATDLSSEVLRQEDEKTAQQEAKPAERGPVEVKPRRFFIDINHKKQREDKKITPGTPGRLI